MILLCGLDAAAACARFAGDDETATALLLEAESVADAGPVPWSYASSALTALALVQARDGDQSEAAPRLERSLGLAEQAGDPWAQGRALDGRATLAADRGDHAAAEQDAADALALQLRLGDQIGAAVSLDILATAAGHRGDLERAARLCAASDTVRDRVSAVVPTWAASRRDALIARVTESVGAARYEQLVTGLAGMSFAEAVRSVG